LAGRCEIDLVQFMLELAEDAYPNLDRVGCLLEIDRLGVALRRSLLFAGERSAAADRDQPNALRHRGVFTGTARPITNRRIAI